MARKPKSESTTGKDPATGDNALSDDERQTLALDWLRKFEAADGAVKEAQLELRAITKLMKAELGKDAVKLMREMIAMRTPKGEAEIRADMERKARAARYMAAPFGNQFELFEKDRTPIVDRATAEGLRDGKLGASRKPDYAPQTDAYRAYMTAYDDGQKSIFTLQRKKDAAAFDQAEAGDEAGDADDGDEGDGDDASEARTEH